MGKASSTNEDEGELYIGYWWESHKKIDHWEGQDVEG
jgi:hypothetical protein